MNETIIIGGGVIGFSVAWALIRRGRSVRIIDAGADIPTATAAAAGMLAPSFEARDGRHEVMQSFGQTSLALWPRFAADLEASAERSVDFQDDGIIGVHFDQTGPMSHDGLRHKEPLLSNVCRSGWFVPGEGQVDPRLVEKALLSILDRDPHCTVERQKVVAISAGDHEVTVTTNKTIFRAARAVIATGGSKITNTNFAWPPIGVTKGEAVAVQLPDDIDPICHVIRSQNVYLCPKADRRIIIGATERPGDRDLSVDPAAIDALKRAAIEILPCLAGAREIERWAGLRPDTPDKEPVIGSAAQGPRTVIFAGGHFRNGILLAPLTAQIIADAIDGEMSEWLTVFRPDRFSDSDVVHHDLRNFTKKEISP